jgi:hypothetical protein
MFHVKTMKVVIKRDFEDIREVDIRTVRIMVPVYDRYCGRIFHLEEKKCIREGIAVIKQIDNLTVVNDKHAKVF